MEKNVEFIQLIDIGITTVQNLMGKAQYQMYHDRYKKIIVNLEDLKDATKRGTLVSSFIYLGVIKLLDHNDPDQLENAILNINQFYCDNYRNLIK